MRFTSQNRHMIGWGYQPSSFYLLRMPFFQPPNSSTFGIKCAEFATILSLSRLFTLLNTREVIIPPRSVKMSVESQYPKSMPYGMSFTPYPSTSELILQLLTVNLGKSGLRVSKVILGCMTYGSKEWQKWTLGEEEAMSHIKAAWVALFFTYYPCLKAFRLSRDELTMTPANLTTIFRRGLIVRQNSTVACRQLL